MSTLATFQFRDHYLSMDGMERFGAYLREQRKRHGWTLDDVQEQVGVDRSWYSRYERSVATHMQAPEEFRKVIAGLGASPIDALLVLGYLAPEDVDINAAPWDAAIPSDVRAVLADIDWTSLRNITRAKMMLETIRDTQQGGLSGRGALLEREPTTSVKEGDSE